MTSRPDAILPDDPNRFERMAPSPPPPGHSIAAQTQRAAIQFDLQTEPTLPAWRDLLRVGVYPQDPFVDVPVIRHIPASDLRRGVANDRFRVRDSRGVVAQPDGDGDYLYSPKEPEFDQVNALYYATLALRICETYAGRPLPWASGMGQLLLDPGAGSTVANAYYYEADQTIAFFNFRAGGREVRAAQSADIVAHELGHAILDGLRDLLNASFSFGPETFHEAFCDSLALLVALHDPGLVERVLRMTDGNLRVPSFLTHLAEELGKLYREREQGPRTQRVFYLRSALNDFTAEKFDSLPYLPEDRITGLGRESHSYSRVYTGALYDILVGIYERLKKSWSAPVALAMARDALGTLLIRSVELGPVGEGALEDFAEALLAADRLFAGGTYQAILTRELVARKVISRRGIKERTEQAALIPDLTLPQSLNSADAARQFLTDHRQALGLPDGTEFYAQAGYRDRQGNRFLTFFHAEPTELAGKQFGIYAGQSVTLYGGVALMFGPDGKLRHVLRRPVAEEDRRRAQVQLADMIAHKHLALGRTDGSGAGEPAQLAILTVGAERSPDSDLFRSVEPDFERVRSRAALTEELAPEVIRVSMHATDQPGILEYARAWIKALALVGGATRKKAAAKPRS
jgi:hypothetical protein